ncbi:hypothetical protein [Methylobacterium sp. CM6246]
MLDTVFWIAVFVAIACGILIIGMGLYDEWLEEAWHSQSGTDELPAA